ncbi:MAG: hypothetical protein DLM70_06470 [Chloroflexi bacterium]|nr:MAG: hypothetical protein DLM70_06470 [Chloroflexota bacterium]
MPLPLDVKLLHQGGYHPVEARLPFWWLTAGRHFAVVRDWRATERPAYTERLCRPTTQVIDSLSRAIMNVLIVR